MKKIFTIIASALLFAACSNDELETKKDVVVTDTSSMYNSNASTDIGAKEEVEAAPLQPAPVRTITRTVYVTRNSPARKVTVREATPAQPDYSPAQAPSTNPQSTGTTTQGTGTGTTGTGTGTEGTATTTKPAEKEKEGMSNATKGAVIGGVGGAVGGAILSKKKGKGAIIGGVIGAAGGYILGRKKDKQQEEATNYNFFTQ